jgi:hypothetical protein
MDKNLSFLKFAVVTFFCIFISFHSYSQIDSLVVGKKYKITLSYGFEATGIVRSITDDTVKIETEYKTFSLPRKDIIEINGISISPSLKDTTDLTHKQIEELRFLPDPNDSRLLLGPTGKTLKGGKAYVSTAVFFPWITVLFLPYSSFGITDYFNIGAGASLYPPVFYFTPKIRALHLEGIDISLGLAYAQTYSFQDINNDYNTGIFYLASTFDITNKLSLTIGSGLLYNIDWQYKNKIYTTGYPHLLLGFEARTDKNFKLITENWIDLGGKRGANFSVLSIGGRYFKDGFAIDVSMVGILTNFNLGGSSGRSYFIPMPWISFAYNFSL